MPSAAILYDEKDPTRTSVTVVFDPATIDTGLEGRDKDLRSPKFFDVSTYPRMVFQSTSIAFRALGANKLRAALTGLVHVAKASHGALQSVVDRLTIYRQSIVDKGYRPVASRMSARSGG